MGALDYHSLPTYSLQRYYTDTISRGLNPSEEEVQDIINEVDQDGSGKVVIVIVNLFTSVTNAAKVEWPEFASVLATLLKAGEEEEENYKETFRVFSKDDEGCIPADEMKFVLSQICSMEVTLDTLYYISETPPVHFWGIILNIFCT